MENKSMESSKTVFSSKITIAGLAVFVLVVLLFGLFVWTNIFLVIPKSQSMEPALNRGDIVIMTKTAIESINTKTVSVNFPLQGKSFWDFAQIAYSTDANGGLAAKKIIIDKTQSIDIEEKGDIISYFSDYRNETIIGRAILKIIASDGTFVITKGDSIYNITIDQDCGRVINGSPERNCIALYPVTEVKGKMLFKIG